MYAYIEEEEEHSTMNQKQLPDLSISTENFFVNYNDMLKKILAIDDSTAENGISSGLCDEASKNGITAPLPAIHLKMEESARRFGNVGIGSSGKSPSFDFGVPFDQTPLLHPFRKMPVRSLSINDFQDRMIQTRYGRNSVDYYAKSEAPFLNNKESDNGSSEMDWGERKLKGNEKGKPRHSFFSACICCIVKP